MPHPPHHTHTHTHFLSSHEVEGTQRPATVGLGRARIIFPAPMGTVFSEA
jgi:hypothetical protein